MSRARQASATRSQRRLLSFGRVWIVAVAVLVIVGAMPMNAAGQSSAARNPIPVLAYYYIWYNPSSWSRAKTDLPLLGRYSSDEREVMRQHIRWAKDAGIEGFIVSWKSRSTLNQRLEKLMEVANEEGFKLGIIYQGLDFEREPLLAARVAADLDLFTSRYAEDEAFDLFSKPLVIWSGTWEFSTEEVAQVTQAHRDDLLILASERNVEGYERLASLVDGDAYYWSSVNPDTFPGYPDKLQAMGEAVHASGGLWIAPAAPGFDARSVGGTTVVERRDGQTLRRQMDAAIGSSPDAVGLISWNEFSENSHVEPSQNHGTRYLEVVADILGGAGPVVTDFDSSAPAATGTSYGLPVLGGLGALVLGGLLITVWRGRSRRSQPSDVGSAADSPSTEVVGGVIGGAAAVATDLDSSAPAARGTSHGLPVATWLWTLILGGLLMMVWRGSRRREPASSAREPADKSGTRAPEVRRKGQR